MEQLNLHPTGKRLPKIASRLTKAATRAVLLFCIVLTSKMGMAQTFPSPSSCTSKDLELRTASLPVATLCNPPAGKYPLVLSIYNKTGSTRTACALWGTLVVRDINGDEIVSLRRTFFACIGPVAKNTTTTKESSQTIDYVPGQSYEIQNIFLAWTTPNANEDCSFLENNSANIAPKCGTQENLKIDAGVSADIDIPSSTCSTGGSVVTVTATGGKPPYQFSTDNTSFSTATSSPYTFPNAFTPGLKKLYIKDATGCSKEFEFTVLQPAQPEAVAGDDFIKTCTSNANGKAIGETPDNTKFTYAWTSNNNTDVNGGLSATNIANPTANPTISTTYTVRKTDKISGCFDDDIVVVEVNKPIITANAGDDFTKSCSSNSAGKSIGAAPTVGFSYSWSPATGLDNTTSSNPFANPSVTTEYTLIKTDDATGCSGTDKVTVTVNVSAPSFDACLVQPTLCASSGSITFTASGNYEYSINGGTNYQDGSTFSNLASGAVSGLKVRNKDNGCTSTMDCSAVPVCTPSAPESTPEQNLAQTFAETTEASASKSLARTVTNSGIAVKAYPNPFSSKVSFNVTSPVAGYGSLELYNMQGQKLTTVFQGRIPEGNSSYDYYVPGNSNATLVYILRVGDKSVTGKLMNVKK